MRENERRGAGLITYGKKGWSRMKVSLAGSSNARGVCFKWCVHRGAGGAAAEVREDHLAWTPAVAERASTTALRA